MTLKEFAEMLDRRQYHHEISKEEELLAKELGFVVVFGYSDDCAELRGAIDAEIDCFDGGLLEHDSLPAGIYANWCPEGIDCSWAYETTIPHEKFCIYEDLDLYCVGIVFDIGKPKKTNADHIRSMTDEELAKFLDDSNSQGCVCPTKDCEATCAQCIVNWLKQPYKEGG